MPFAERQIINIKDLQKNIVPSSGQNKGNLFLYENTGLRILFAGNSITKHSPKPEIGWTKDCGMAASSADKDYVHLLMQKIRQYDPCAAYGIAQVADYECHFQEEEAIERYRAAADFQADIVLMFFGANVPGEYDTQEHPIRTFGEAYEELRELLSNGCRAAVFHAQCFYIRPKLDEEKRAVAEKYGEPFISLDHIIHREETHGQFNHPNDLGMEEIADTFWQTLEPVVKRLAHTLKR